MKINCTRYLGRLSTNVVTLLLIQIHSEINISLKNDLRERKGRIHKLFIGLRLWPTCLIKNTALPEKPDIFMKNGNGSWDVLSDSRKRYCGPWADIGKYWLGKEPIRLQDLLLCPLKKINMVIELDLLFDTIMQKKLRAQDFPLKCIMSIE